MAFEHRLRVRFHEIDRAGIVYFARIFEYCHVAYEDMLCQALGMDMEQYFKTTTWGMPLVHAEADYERPNFLGEYLNIRLEVARLGQRSVTFAYELSGDDGRRAKVSLTHAFVELASFEPITCPEAFRAGLAKLSLLPAQA